MDKLVFDSVEYDTIPFGACVNGASARFSLIRPKRKSIAKMCESVTGCDLIKLVTVRGKILAEYRDFTEFSYHEVQDNYLMPKANPEDPDVFVTVVNVVLRKPDTDVTEEAEEE